MSDLYNNAIGELFRGCREESGMSIQDAADELVVLAVDAEYIASFEEGALTPPLNVLSEMFEVVGFALQLEAVPLV